VRAPERNTGVIVVDPMSDEAGGGKYANHDHGGGATPERNRNARQEDDRVNDGLERREPIPLSDWRYDENVGDQQNEEDAKAPFAKLQAANERAYVRHGGTIGA